MTGVQFAVDDNGQVWAVNGRMRRLGQIQHLIETRTPVGFAVRAWWRSMSDDTPIPRVAKVGKRYQLVERSDSRNQSAPEGDGGEDEQSTRVCQH